MKWMSLNTLRETFLSYFEGKGHLRLDSFPLIPQNDKSLLLINSGMAPMKKFFTGEVTPPRKRVTTCQKCIRTPDIERVGKTARHGTYFEMLGNFSFGDYFKSDAIAWAWKFCVDTLEMPVDRLWVSIYQDDDEAYSIWTQQVGVPPERVVRLGKEDNFWEHGTGPCGPCSEIYFDRGEAYGCGSPTCGVGCDCDRYVEFWNLVFTQFDSDGKGNYTPLQHPNIDTGMGLERLAVICQGVDNLFEIDTVQRILSQLTALSGVAYKSDEKKDVSMRVITDHIRSTCMMIADGVMPSNEGRGYVLRRLLRRAARHGRLLGLNRPFLYELSQSVIENNQAVYPALVEKKALIQKVILVEEESFGRTIDQGLSMLQNFIQKGEKILSGEDAFILYDTYGFPLDLTQDILEEEGMQADTQAFEALMAAQRERSRASRGKDQAQAWKGDVNLLKDVAATAFCGYTQQECSAAVRAIVVDGAQADAVGEGEQAVLVLNQTCFYAESGGQTGDTGRIESENGVFLVQDTQKNADGVYLHIGRVQSGIFQTGDGVRAVIDGARRAAIRRNHTAAHLLQAALREVLGAHVEQAGQMVDERVVRFDFTHFSAMRVQELVAVEAWVNRAILEGLDVSCEEMPKQEAVALGATALFGEKYGETVRVVTVPGKSIELCGGTHIDNTAKLGLFQILSESSIASGVRRIEAVTGENVLELIARYKGLLEKTAAALKAGDWNELPEKTAQLQQTVKEKEKALTKLHAKLANAKADDLLTHAKAHEGVRIVEAVFEGVGQDALRNLCDQIKSRATDAVAVFADQNSDGVLFAVAAGKDALQKGAHAGKIVSALAAAAGGKGGGRPDFAMAGAKDAAQAAAAMKRTREFVLSTLQ